MIDTGKITPELAADLVVRAARAIRTTGWSGEATTAGLEVDPILGEAVQEELDRQLAPA